MIDYLSAVQRLKQCGLDEASAVVLVNDFYRERDIPGLAEYVRELEALHSQIPENVAAV